MAMASSEPICPTIEYSDLKKDPMNYCEVIAEIKGLEKKRFGSSANADITFKMKERSFVLCVNVNPLKSKGKVKDNYRLEVKQLPAEIDPEKSKYEVKTGKIVIHLRKAVSGSWAGPLSHIGLEHSKDS